MGVAAVATSLALCAAARCTAQAQETGKSQPVKAMAKEADPDWDVATVKASDPNDTRGHDFFLNGRRVGLRDITVRQLLLLGYGVQKSQLAGLPNWAISTRWDVDGTPDAEGQPSLSQLQGMVRKLLAERFVLQLHHEQRQRTALALTAAQGSSKLTADTSDPDGWLQQRTREEDGRHVEELKNVSMAELAIILQDPHTGEILAMVSRPAFDPNQFSVRLSSAYWKSIMDDPNHPMMNKTIQAQLPPGSTFKVVMTLAGLQENLAQDMHVVCNGGVTLYGHFFGCDRHHGSVDIHNALPYSCDSFYFELANKLGIDKIYSYAHSVGLGQKTGIDLPDEQAGIVPSQEWKLKTQHERWYPSEAISVGIGQGATEETPMQEARALGGIASGGVFVRPHMLMPGQISAEQQAAIDEAYPGSGVARITMTPENWEIITDDMANVLSPIGTAAAAHLDGIDFAGKTGTADVVSGRKKGSADKATIPHSWFVGMTPRRNPDIVVAVLWEHGYMGNNSAKLAAQVIDTYVTKQRKLAGNLQNIAAANPDHTEGERGRTPDLIGGLLR
jgi:uncharacterized protein (TIGR03435 family)